MNFNTCASFFTRAARQGLPHLAEFLRTRKSTYGWRGGLPQSSRITVELKRHYTHSNPAPVPGIPFRWFAPPKAEARFTALLVHTLGEIRG